MPRWIHALIGRFWTREFMRGLARAGLGRETRRHIRARARAIYRAWAAASPDPAEAMTLRMCAGVLAADAVLREEGTPPETARDMLRAAVMSAGSARFRAWVRRWLDTEADPVGAMLARPDILKPSRLMFGRFLTLNEDRGPDHASIIVRQCGFARVFRDAGRPELTKHFCAFDAAWLDDINAHTAPVRALRPGTIAGGAPVCEFRFERARTP